ncbi:hypothetical protein NW762_008910 [Fusarium torreyae]|uniref:Uncharacterized protein n=1 Tax=Fusarium torreyae TaxID=1237075 RepID=A0A9W8VBS3_9HYPO|nr:hypothetical protein NW762_008910 [Fusarium torreyae]
MTNASISLSDARPVEILFLDIPVSDVVQRADYIQVFEPWATQYVDAIHEGRFGDAIWARYHMMGGVKSDGKLEGADITVTESITEDAVAYKQGYPEDYAKAVSLFQEYLSQSDGHLDILEIVFRIGREDVSGIRVPESV